MAGGAEESIYQPGWLPDGSLVFASDRDGWWRLYRAVPPFTTVTPVLKTPPPETEFGRPQWILATATWASAGRDQLVVSFTKAGRWHLGRVDLATGTLTPIAPGVQPDEWLAASASEVALVAGQSGAADAVMVLPLDGRAGPDLEARLGHRARPGVRVRGRSDRVSDHERPAGACLLLCAAQRGGVGSARENARRSSSSATAAR